MREPTGLDLSKVYFRPATCGKRPAISSIWLTPFSSEATRSAPVSWKVARVLEKGSTVSTSPMVIWPASIEARSPPELAIEMVTPWSATRSSWASATRLPIEHSSTRQTLRSPSMAAVALPITSAFSASSGLPSSATRSRKPWSGLTEASSRIGAPVAETTLPASSQVTVRSPSTLPYWPAWTIGTSTGFLTSVG